MLGNGEAQIVVFFNHIHSGSFNCKQAVSVYVYVSEKRSDGHSKDKV